MNNGIITLISGVVETGAISFLVYKIIQGLKKQVDSLKETVEIQSKTIETMDKRLLETEKLSDLYKSFINDYPKTFEAYKTTIVKTKDEIIVSLQDKLEERQTTIESLDKSLRESELYVRISTNLVKSEYKSVLNLIRQLDLSHEEFISKAMQVNSFDEFLTKQSIKFFIDDEIDFQKWMNVSHHSCRAKSFSINVNGISYVITFGNEIYMTSIGKHYFDNAFKTMKGEIKN